MHRAEFEPGAWVRNPARLDWGLGQVQTAVGPKVTVMFEHAGKVVINSAVVTLNRADLPRAPLRGSLAAPK